MAERGGKRCVAFGCGNTNADGVSLHFFPLQNKELCRQWTKFVTTKRKWPGPTKFSVLCSDHFTEDSFPVKYSILASMGRTPPKRKTLNKDAVPTIHTPIVRSEQVSEIPERIQPIGHSTPKKQRTAFLKREASRIALEYSDQMVESDMPQDSVSNDSIFPIPELAEDHMLYTSQKNLETNTRTFGTQATHIQRLPKKRSRRIQVYPDVQDKVCQTRKPSTRSIAVQCSILKPVQKSVEAEKQDIEGKDSSDVDSSEESVYEEDPNDTSYSLPESDEQDSEKDCSFISDDDRSNQVSESRLFLVCEAALMALFQTCSKCYSPTLHNITRVFGTMVKVEQDCGVCGHNYIWNSQSKVGEVPMGNLMLSSAILFSGALPSKTLRLFNIMKVPVITVDTFFKHQRYFLQPAVTQVWESKKLDYITEILAKDKPICIGGDGRCDTPGHSAKYGSYSVMDLEQGNVIDIQLVQSNEVQSSCHMEKEGLARSVEFLKDAGIKIGTLVTDRHVQIRKWVRENMAETEHCVDVWHVAKGLKKRLVALSNSKENEALQPWIKSITNHLYWTAVSTPDGDRDTMVQKWQSLWNHIQNKHEGHGDLFPNCTHQDLTGQARRKRWLTPGTVCLQKLWDLMTSRQMKLDIPMLSREQQTSELEGYHSVINHFAPKMIGFSYHGMKCRLILAALHFNENGRRAQAHTEDGEPCYKITYPKHKKGGYTLREVKVESTYGYVDELIRETLSRASSSTLSGFSFEQEITHKPPALCSSYDRPSKKDAAAERKSRFLEKD